MGETYDPFIEEIKKSEELNKFSDAIKKDGLYLIRKVKLINYSISNNILTLNLEKENEKQIIDFIDQKMYLDTTSSPQIFYLLTDYIKVYDPINLFDILIKSEKGRIIGLYFWLYVKYSNINLKNIYGKTRTTSLKPDSLFAFRLANSQKTEYHMMKVLSKLGHNFNREFNECVCIDYAKGRDRLENPDLRCTNCNIKFEVKSRIRDYHIRFSHSPSRPFWSENSLGDYNILIFPDKTYLTFKNDCLIKKIKQKDAEKKEKYDYYVQFNKTEVHDCIVTDSNLICLKKKI